MPLPTGDTLKRQVAAAGGSRGDKPILPLSPEDWRPGMPCHWTEQSKFWYWKSRFLRVFSILNLTSGIVYLVYRCAFTIGVFTKHPVLIAYQIFFLLLEAVSVFSVIFRVIELWDVTYRNSIDFKHIPNEQLSSKFAYEHIEYVRPQYSNYPSVAVFIPCYNEEPDLVLDTILGAVAIDYPQELISVYLCDDGRDDEKKHMIDQLRKEHTNLFYVTRPDNSHAKAGNLNYSLERTRSDLVVTLDADFVPRPKLLQRLLSYYYIWNPETGMYEFNDLLAVVQTPQHFRNLSPYDSDPLDQRATFFCEVIMPGKDYWNASTMIGTNNLLSRVPLAEAGFYPYYSITEDSAMSLAFHSLGYRSFYVNESLASGLATTALHSNIGQRSRWLKGDYQILFNKKGPAAVRGLSLAQRLLYLNMTYTRLVSIVHFFYDALVVLLLVFAISPLDAPDIIMFFIFFSAYILSSVLLRFVAVSGGQGLDKSESGSMAFESIFRYPTVKGLFIALFKGQNLKFKVTDKSTVQGNKRGLEALQSSVDPEGGEYGPDESGMAGDSIEPSRRNAPHTGNAPRSSGAHNEDGYQASYGELADESSGDGDMNDEEIQKPKRYYRQNKEERHARRVDVRKNLKRLWFNILCAVILIFALIWAFIFPPLVPLGSTVRGTQAARDSSLLQLAVAYGFALVNLLPHMMAIYLCFIPYVSGWIMSDLVHGRCDQYAVNRRNGKLFVPWSFISLLSLAKAFIMLGALSALVVYIFVRKNVTA